MRVRALMFLPLGAWMSACGGSGGNPAPVTLTVPSDAGIDGTLSTLGALSTVGVVIRVGDEDLAQPGSTVVAFLSFDVAAIPAQAQVTNAVLRIRMNNSVGTPETGHGDVVVDDVDIGASLDPADPTQVFASVVATLADDTADPQFVSLTDRVAAAVAAGRTRLQLRLRYEIPTDADGANDWTNYISGNSSIPENVPLLVVTYQN